MAAGTKPRPLVAKGAAYYSGTRTPQLGPATSPAQRRHSTMSIRTLRQRERDRPGSRTESAFQAEARRLQESGAAYGRDYHHRRSSTLQDALFSASGSRYGL